MSLTCTHPILEDIPLEKNKQTGDGVELAISHFKLT